MARRTPSIGERVTIALLNGYTGEPNGKTDSGIVHRLTPFGSPEILFDDGSYAIVGFWQVRS